MTGVRALCLWTFLINAGPAVVCSTSSNPQFLAREEGDSVVLPCQVNQTKPPPIGVYLKRSWLKQGEVIFKYEGAEVSVKDPSFHNRTTVSGDPSNHALNITLSDLRPSDTDRYYCEFNFHNQLGEDTVQRGNTEFFLYVSGVLDVNRELVDTCVGSSVVLPCVPPVGDSSAVEGVVLKRQRGQQAMEILYHSKHTSWSPQLSVDRFQLSTAPGPRGISYSLTMGNLQPEDGGLYSCQLLLHGRSHCPSMGQQGKYVSVQGDQCGCSSYSILIYVLSAAVAVIFVLLLVVVIIYRGKRKQAKAVHTPAPIYEEMTGLQPKSTKRSRSRPEEDQSEYRNISLKNSCPENHYESPKGALGPQT